MAFLIKKSFDMMCCWCEKSLFLSVSQKKEVEKNVSLKSLSSIKKISQSFLNERVKNKFSIYFLKLIRNSVLDVVNPEKTLRLLP